MKLDARTAAKIARLNEEMDEIHRANSLYWEQGRSQTVRERAAYEFRNERLEKIRAELDQIRSKAKGAPTTLPRGRGTRRGREASR
jgi:hypothetical protein